LSSKKVKTQGHYTEKILKSIPTNHKPEPIDIAVQEEIDQILKNYEKVALRTVAAFFLSI